MRSFLLIPLVFALSACGNTLTRTEAINEAALAVCDYYQRCDEIGPGEAYPDRNECMNDQRSFFQDLWTYGACEENMNEDGFAQCINRVEIAQCGNLLDLANVLLNCTQGRVCGGNEQS